MIKNILDIEKGIDERNFEESDVLLNDIQVLFHNIKKDKSFIKFFSIRYASSIVLSNIYKFLIKYEIN